MSIETFLDQFAPTPDGSFFQEHMRRWDIIIKAIEIIGDSVKQGDHWLYPVVDHDGYGRVRFNGRNTTASRLVLSATTGKPLNYADMDACHSTPLCPHRNCVNPEHLYWETHAENCRRREAERRARKAIAPLAGDLVGNLGEHSEHYQHRQQHPTPMLCSKL